MSLLLEIKFESHTSKCPDYVSTPVGHHMTTHDNKTNCSCLDTSSTKVPHDNKTKLMLWLRTYKVRWELCFFLFVCFASLFLAVVAFPKRCSTWTHFTAALPLQMRPIDLDINRMCFGSVWLRKPGYRRVNIAWLPLSQLGCLARDENHADYFQFFFLSLSWFDEDTNLLRDYIFGRQINSVRFPFGNQPKF